MKINRTDLANGAVVLEAVENRLRPSWVHAVRAVFDAGCGSCVVVVVGVALAPRPSAQIVHQPVGIPDGWIGDPRHADSVAW